MEATAILRKLKIQNAQRMLVINAPYEYQLVLQGLNAEQTFDQNDKGKFDFVHIFASSRDELMRLVKEFAGAGRHDCLFWISYPKGGGKIKSDIKRDTVWAAFTLIGLRPVSQISIDETWSATDVRGRRWVNKLLQRISELFLQLGYQRFNRYHFGTAIRI